MIFIKLIFSLILGFVSQSIAVTRKFDYLISSQPLFNKGYLIDPGRVELQDVTFITTSDWYYSRHGNDGLLDALAPKRNNYTTSMDYQRENVNSSHGFIRLDVIFFRSPETCTKNRDGCNWVDLGVGVWDGDSEVLCCTDQNVAMGICASSSIDRIIINDSKFKGIHRVISLNTNNEQITEPFVTSKMSRPKFETNEGTGLYTLVVSNCGKRGRKVIMEGRQVWIGKSGYLPGNYGVEWNFIIVLTFLWIVSFTYLGIIIIFDARPFTPVQKILLTGIGIGLLTCLFRSLDYFIWNYKGKRDMYVYCTWNYLRLIKATFLCIALLIVSQGWCVIFQTLGKQKKRMLTFGFGYTLVNFTQFTLDYKASNKNEGRKFEPLEIGSSLLFLINLFIHIIMYVSIVCSSRGFQFKDMTESEMLTCRRLRKVFLMFIHLYILWWGVGVLIFFMTDKMSTESYYWIFPIFQDMLDLFFLITVALIYRHRKRRADVYASACLPDEDLELDESIDDTNSVKCRKPFQILNAVNV